ncbi:MAG: MEDS domain-containing protein [Ktedonobacteraceae bacterium]|nr:MEDS domain-containing protein [Ktedonobacteraceae bacterium]
MTIKQAAAFLHVSETSLRRWTNSGQLRCFRVGGRNERRFLLADLLAFMPSAQAEQTTAEDNTASGSADEERHICLFFLNEDEQWQMMRTYLLAYLNSEEPVLYIQDSTAPERLQALLRAEGLPVESLIERGLLRIVPPAEAYLLGGSFDVDRMLAFMESQILAALATGHRRVLLTGEMSWSLAKAPGSEQLMNYEALLNPLVEKYPPVTIICQYDLRRFDGPSVLDAFLTHPTIHLPDRRVPGFYGL